jgi:hypothetical protein
MTYPMHLTRTNWDFESIRAAVLETERGRWFLSEFERRLRQEHTESTLRIIRELCRGSLSEHVRSQCKCERVSDERATDVADLREPLQIPSTDIMLNLRTLEGKIAQMLHGQGVASANFAVPEAPSSRL